MTTINLSNTDQISAASEEPLIWTSKGNLPLSSLTHQTAWDVQPTYYKFMERYLDATGEVVKESAHVYLVEGVQALAEAATIG